MDNSSCPHVFASPAMPTSSRSHQRYRHLTALADGARHDGLTSPVAPLLTRLTHFITLPEPDRQRLCRAVTHLAQLDRGQTLVQENERPAYVHIVVSGWSCRYKALPNGERVILGYLLPGDVCDVHIALLDHMDHSIQTLSPATFALIPRETITAIFEHHTTLAYAFFWASLIEESIQREWFVNNTGRPADQRLAHLLCEVQLRHCAAGLARGPGIAFPVTQQDLADALGITVVHTNRMLRQLRSAGWITCDHRQLFIHDWSALAAHGAFDPGYMHLSENGFTRPHAPSA